MKSREKEASVECRTSAWLTGLLIYGGAFLIGVNLVAVPASSVYLKELHGFSDQQYGAVFLPQLFAAIVGALIAGPAVLRMSLRSMYMISLTLFALSLAALSVSSLVRPDTALPLIMLATALFGFGFGFGGGPLNGIVCLQYTAATNSALTALHTMAGLGLVLGPLYFSGFEATDMWRFGPLLAMFFALLLLLVVPIGLERDQPQVSSEQGKGLPLTKLYFWLMLAIALLYGFVEATYSNWAVIFVNEVRSLSAAVAAGALSAFWGGVTLGRFVTTFVVRAVSPFKIWLALPPVMALAFLLIPSAAGAIQIVLTFALAGLACSSFFPLMVVISTEPYPHAVSWIVSMLTAALMTGIGIVSYLVGSMIQTVPMDDVYVYSLIYPTIIFALMIMTRLIQKK